jgi:CheY-like chemotaxis protein
LLTIMTTTASLLEHMVDDPEARALLGEIVDAAQRGSALNRQLLSTTRAEVQTPSVIDVNELVQSTTKLARRLVGSGIHVDVDLRAGGWAVRADANALEQALLNLVANARDAMPSGGNVALSADRYVLDADDDDLPAGRYVRITVEDDGDGMPPEVLARAGEAFFTTKPTGRGTGLGLASVMETVRRADGRVRIESHAGRGTTVELFLPVVEAMAPSSRATGAVFRGSERVLFVDDDETIRRLVPRALRAKGYDVITASNAQEARAIFEEQPHVQVLVTDVVMIGVSGPELAAELRRQRPDLKVLFVSGYTPQHVLSLRDLPDGSAFVSKPCTPRQIAAKLRELLDHREDPVDLSP